MPLAGSADMGAGEAGGRSGAFTDLPVALWEFGLPTLCKGSPSLEFPSRVGGMLSPQGQ